LLTQSWEDKQTGQKKYRTVVRATDCVVLSPVDSDESGDEHDEA
jgi:hypothetical protein